MLHTRHAGAGRSAPRLVAANSARHKLARGQFVLNEVRRIALEVAGSRIRTINEGTQRKRSHH